MCSEEIGRSGQTEYTDNWGLRFGATSRALHSRAQLEDYDAADSVSAIRSKAAALFPGQPATGTESGKIDCTGLRTLRLRRICKVYDRELAYQCSRSSSRTLLPCNDINKPIGPLAKKLNRERGQPGNNT